jgi:hypothetical protein
MNTKIAMIAKEDGIGTRTGNPARTRPRTSRSTAEGRPFSSLGDLGDLGVRLLFRTRGSRH